MKFEGDGVLPRNTGVAEVVPLCVAEFTEGTDCPGMWYGCWKVGWLASGTRHIPASMAANLASIAVIKL